MSTPNIKLKKEVFGGTGLSFEDYGAGEFCGNKKADAAAIAKGHAALELFSMGVL